MKIIKKLKPCPKCGCKDIKDYDCGYSFFNCGHYKCEQCGFTISWDWTTTSLNIWNEECKNYKIRIRALNKLTAKEKEVLGWTKEKIKKTIKGFRK